MSKQEPVIHVSGMNDEELHSWFIGKTQRLHLLQELMDEKARLEENLIQLKARIEIVSSEARLDVFRPD